MLVLEDILKARDIIGKYVHKTPILSSSTIDKIAGGEIYFKCENFQKTGSFKLRGAFNNILSNLEKNREKGVIAFSSGNHAQAVAYAARALDIKATIIMQEFPNLIKVRATKGYAANVILYGKDGLEMEEKAMEIKEKENYNLIHPYDDYEIIAGQGTIGLEILDDLPDVGEVYVPIGGGGLISGIATSIKSLRPEIKVIGVEPEKSCSMLTSVSNNKITEVAACKTIADGLTAQIPSIKTFDIVRKYVDEIIIVSEEEIKEAVLLYLLRAKLFIEPSGAVTLAAILNKKVKSQNKKLAVISGGNSDTIVFEKILNEFNKNIN
jgi:threonine dehydratase